MIKFTAAAQKNIEETGCDPREDIAAVRSGAHTRESLLAYCLDGADEDRVQGWREYVDTICDVAAAAKITGMKDIAQACIVSGVFESDPRTWDLLASIHSGGASRNQRLAALQALVRLEERTVPLATAAEHHDDVRECQWIGIAEMVVQAEILADTAAERESLFDGAREMVEFLTQSAS